MFSDWSPQRKQGLKCAAILSLRASVRVVIVLHSELFKIPYEWGGVPIFGFGVLLLLWAIASAITIGGLARRYGWGMETWSALPMLLVLGAAIVLLPRMFPGGLPIRGYGAMLLAGILAGVGMAMYRARQGGLDSEMVISAAFWLVVCGVVGARLFYVVEYWDEKFAGKGPRETLLEIINVPQGGLVIYGGFIGAIVGFTVFVRKHKLPFFALADIAAPSMMIGLALGRIGCLLNGCCYGGQTDWPWHVSFPHSSPPYEDQASRGEFYGFRLETRDGMPAVVARVDASGPAVGLKVGDVVQVINEIPIKSLADARAAIVKSLREQSGLKLQLGGGNKAFDIRPVVPPPRSRPVHPTQIYSAIDAGLLAWLMWSFFPFRNRDGQCIALLLTIHPITRFLLEVIRTDEPAVFGTGLSISQNISIALLGCAAAIWWYVSRRPPGVTWPLVPAGTPSQGGLEDANRQVPAHRAPPAQKKRARSTP
jgi:phosphatidylglycerol:prolipoprotein diacylglycerol transferase